MFATLFVAAAISAQTVKGQTVKVLSYNIHHGEGTDGKFDLARIARVIQSAAPDLVAVQEVDVRTRRSGGVDQAAELARLTGMHAVFGRTIDYQDGWYGNLLLSRWPVQGFTAQAFPFTPGREARGAIEATVKHPAEFRFFATHLDITEKDRLLAAEWLARRIAEHHPANAPMILAGDFNAAPGTAAYKALAAHWTFDPHERPTSPAENPSKQIDFVVFRPEHRWKVVSTSVLDEPVASDHRPILVTLELQDPEFQD
jgi:endonuclease/exonuclease/phosphatase family metal-dependent hydrolase